MFPGLPKPMIPVRGVPFIEYQMDTLHSLGISEFVLCVGYMADVIISHFSGDDSSNRRPYSIQFSVEKEQLGTGGAIRNALPILDAEFLVVNGDTFVKFDLAGMERFHRISKSDCTLLLSKRQDTSDYGTVRVRGDWKVTGFEEKGVSAGPAFVSAGAYIVKKGMFEGTPVKFSFERELLPALVDRGMVFGYPTQGQFVDIGTPERFLAFKQQAESQL